MAHDGVAVSRAEFEATLFPKLASDVFLEDIRLLIPTDVVYDPVTAAVVVKDELIAKLPGAPWKGDASPPPDSPAGGSKAKTKRR